MSTVLTEGFDKYGPTNIANPSTALTLAEGGWSLAPETIVNITPPLSAQGYSATFNSFAITLATSMTRGVGSNMSRIIGGFKFQSNLAVPCGIQFGDVSTIQCSIVINATSGIIGIYQGAFGGLLQNGTAAVAANTTNELEFDITFGTGGLGGWSVWLNGVQILGGTGTTQQSGNDYCNFFSFVHKANVSNDGTLTVDDVYIFNSSGATNNAVLLTNPAVVTQFPIADSAVQFANQGNVVGNFASNALQFSAGANHLYLIPFTPVMNCTASEISLWANNTGATPNFRGVLYADSAGIPGALLTSGTQITGCTTGQQLSLPLTTPTALVAGTQYWFGYITDTSVNFLLSVFGGSVGAIAANTYTSGAPSSAPAMTFGQLSLALCCLCVSGAHNWASENQNPPPGDVSSVAGSTDDTVDLYQFSALPTNISAIYTISVVGNVKLASPGARTFDLVCKSSATLSGGSNTDIAPTTTYAWYESFFDTDPNTSAPWTYTNAGNALCGMELIA